MIRCKSSVFVNDCCHHISFPCCTICGWLGISALRSCIFRNVSQSEWAGKREQNVNGERGNNAVNMEPIRLLNWAKYAKVFLIITTAISITAAAGLTAAFYKSVNCTTFLIQHKPATILISIINLYVLLIRQQQSEGIVAALQNTWCFSSSFIQKAYGCMRFFCYWSYIICID